MRKKLVITGMGAITPIGLNVNDYWASLLKGVSGTGPITRFNAEKLPTRIGAEVKGFEDIWPQCATYSRYSSLFMSYALAAAEEALRQADIEPRRNTESIGVAMGTALGGAVEFCDAGARYENSATGKISPHLVPCAIPNMSCCQISIMWGFHGPGFTLSTACSAGADALMTAALAILAGHANAMLVMAGECGLSPAVISSLSQAHALSRCNDSPETASRPFDLNRDGFVIGEGGGAIFLETEQHALRRGAHILAELRGWANTLDGYHITAPDPSGKWAAMCMRKALASAEMDSGDIDYINAHGTATRLGDQAETTAIMNVFGPVGIAPPVSSTKGATGHLMGAGGLTEVIACVLAVRENILPPTLNLLTPDPDCCLDYIPLKAKKRETRAAMSNALGFGGQNSSIIVRRYDKE